MQFYINVLSHARQCPTTSSPALFLLLIHHLLLSQHFHPGWFLLWIPSLYESESAFTHLSLPWSWVRHLLWYVVLPSRNHPFTTFPDLYVQKKREDTPTRSMKGRKGRYFWALVNSYYVIVWGSYLSKSDHISTPTNPASWFEMRYVGWYWDGSLNPLLPFWIEHSSLVLIYGSDGSGSHILLY